jgi:hypothetical protein
VARIGGLGGDGRPRRRRRAVVVPTASDGLVALPVGGCGSSTCGPLWTAPSTAAIEQLPVAAGSVVFAGAADGELSAFAVAGCGDATCGPLWTTTIAGSFDAPMAVGSGHLVVTVDGVLHAFAPAA